MNRLTSQLRATLYPMVGVTIVGSLWMMAYADARSQRVQSDADTLTRLQDLRRAHDRSAADPVVPR